MEMVFALFVTLWFNSPQGVDDLTFEYPYWYETQEQCFDSFEAQEVQQRYDWIAQYTNDIARPGYTVRAEIFCFEVELEN